MPFSRWYTIRDGGIGSPAYLTTYLFWFKPVSIFGLALITAFTSTSPELTCPGLLAPTALMLAVAVSAGAFTADPRIEVTLSPKLQTSSLPVTPVGVADRWRNIG